MIVPVTTRAKWGARRGRGSLDPGPEANVVIHNSYRPALSPSATVAEEIAAVLQIERFHTDPVPRGRGWAGIGYNWLVAPSGRVYEGRGWKYRGAHAGLINGDSIGICLLIDGTTTEPTPAMMQSTRHLISIGVELGELRSDYKISGHRDHKATECPGDLVYARLEEFYHTYIPIVVWPHVEDREPDLVGDEYVPTPIWELKKSVDEILGLPARTVVNATVHDKTKFGEALKEYVEWLADQPEVGTFLKAASLWVIRQLTEKVKK